MTSTENKPKMSLHARRNIRDEYDKKINDTLNRIQKYVAEPDLKFDPNFEENYARLLALDSSLDRAEPGENNRLNREWQETFGMKTREYFEGLADKLSRDNFRQDAELQKSFKAAVFAKVVALHIVKEEMEEPCDAIIQDGKLVLKVALDQFGISPYHAPRDLQHVLEISE